MAHHPGHPHLPPDVEPGGQSNRMRVGRGLSGCLLPFMVIGGFFFLAAFSGFALLLGSVPELDGPSPVFLALIGVCGALVTWVVSYAVFRGFRPRRDRSLAVSVQPLRARRGEEVYASLESGGDNEGIELGLVCRVAYDTIRRRSRIVSHRGPHRSTSTATVFEQWVPATLGQAALTVPEDGPYSYEGAAISFAWSVQARRTAKRAASAPAPVWVTC